MNESNAMPNRFSPTLPFSTLVIATHNAGKVKEFARLINHDGLTLKSAGELGLPEPDETGDSFEANARLKAYAAAQASGLPALADDSGLCIDALNGAPGIYSARWAVHKDFSFAFTKIQGLLLAERMAQIPTPERLRDSAERMAQTPEKAAFVCVLALTFPDGKTYVAEGKVGGHLTFPPRGEHGFGYDPIFIPIGETRSFAEMAMADKQKYSHRAKAVEALLRLIAPSL